jgi:predicted nuclease of predicted toxin-antitoxin system
VKLLFDQNLSHRLPARLADFFPDSAHVRAATLDRAPDDQIWEYARANDFCIVTQDSDFAERSRLYGAPPKVVWLRCGNSAPQQVEAILRRNAVLITELMWNPALHYVEII